MRSSTPSLAVEEAVTNIIVHGYPPDEGEIRIRFRAAPRHIRIRIEDSAPPFNPLALPDPDIYGDVEERKIGGLGVFLIPAGNGRGSLPARGQ